MSAAPAPQRLSRAAARLLTGRSGALIGLLVVASVLLVLRLALGGDGEQAGGPTGPSGPATPSSSPTPSGSTGPSASPLPSASVSAILPAPTSTPTPAPLPSTTCVPQTTTARLRVVTYNIKSGRYLGYSRLPELLAELASVHPDVVLLQEVDKNRPISGRRDEPALLGAGLGYQYTFGLNVLRPGDSEYGTAILSRHQIQASNNVHLPNAAGEQQRGLLGVSIQLKGIGVNIYDTHLTNQRPSTRLAQISSVTAILAQDPAPKILGGDLNAIPSSPVLHTALRSLSDTWAAVGRGPGRTVPASSPRARIDYLLYQQGQDPATTITPVSARVLGVGSSDHRAVLASYRLVASADPVCVPTG